MEYIQCEIPKSWLGVYNHGKMASSKNLNQNLHKDTRQWSNMLRIATVIGGGC